MEPLCTSTTIWNEKILFPFLFKKKQNNKTNNINKTKNQKHEPNVIAVKLRFIT